ncbi:MAG TPA: beta-ketoacyl synthase N-terminal-like domain-containing protein [Actinospica sp.]|jgi:3-oxoacyl-[acyl-carrier-protein] synthase II|nr:beta-ketoacyl synthase N-terminal-like domain-containing protein [Actinospica sp.]
MDKALTPARPGPRYAVAGSGAIASTGRNAPELYEALCAARSGLAPLRGFDADRFRARHAYEIDDRPGRDVPGRATAWLLEAIAEALASAGLGEDLSEIPVFVGTGLRELRSAELWWTEGAPFPARRLHFGPALAERFGAVETYTVNNACSASLYALALAADRLATGEQDVVVAAGVDSITASMFGLLDRVHAEPVDRVRPFDRNRRGVLMGDGAAAVVLRRTAERPLAWLRSVAVNCDAFHVTAPDGAGVAAAIERAHGLAGLDPAQIDLVFAHGTGTLLNDEVEAGALTKVFDVSTGQGPLVTAIKSMTGHTSGGSGLMSLVVAVETLRHGRIPPTVGLEEPVPDAEGLRFVTGEALRSDVRRVQVDAFGFGGVNAVAVLEKAGL